MNQNGPCPVPPLTTRMRETIKLKKSWESDQLENSATALVVAESKTLELEELTVAMESDFYLMYRRFWLSFSILPTRVPHMNLSLWTFTWLGADDFLAVTPLHHCVDVGCSAFGLADWGNGPPFKKGRLSHFLGSLVRRSGNVVVIGNRAELII